VGGVSQILGGVLLGLGASAAWALANIFIQRAGREAGVLPAMLWGQLLGGALLAIGLVGWPMGTWPESWGWVVVGGLASGLAYYGLFRSLAGGPVSVTSPVVAGWALLSVLFGIFLFDEQLTGLRAVGCALVIVGIVGVAAGPMDQHEAATWREPKARVIGWALAACLGFGVMVATLKPLGEALGPVAAILVLWGAQWVFMGPLAARSLRGRMVPPRAAWWAIAAFGLLETVGFVSVEVGTLTAPITVVAPAASLGSLITVLLGKVWLGEAVGPRRLIFSVIVMGGVVLLGLS
jgi:drug/metabolite transporter (DMT)-like permease